MNTTSYLAVLLSAAASSEIARKIQESSPWWHLTLGTSFNTLFWIGVGCFIVVLKNKNKAHSDSLYIFLYSFALTVAVVVGVPELTGYKWTNQGFQACVGMVLGMTAQNWGDSLIEWAKDRFLGKGSRNDE